MTASNPRAIILRSVDTPIVDEYRSLETIKPGHCLEYVDGSEIELNEVTGGPLQYIAIENLESGKTIDDEYSTGDSVKAWIPQIGDKFYGLVAAGSNIGIGSPCRTVSDGTFEQGSLETGEVYSAVALEAVDNTSGSSAARIKLMRV